MATPTRPQLALGLEPEPASLPQAPMPEEVIVALADLLLEAYGTDELAEPTPTGVSDER